LVCTPDDEVEGGDVWAERPGTTASKPNTREYDTHLIAFIGFLISLAKYLVLRT
jgi:hypothetical protein